MKNPKVGSHYGYIGVFKNPENGKFSWVVKYGEKTKKGEHDNELAAYRVAERKIRKLILKKRGADQLERRQREQRG